MALNHTFHIPVLGIGFTVDTPVKVAHYGISSVISLVDDLLIERMREYHCQNSNIPFKAITDEVDNYREKRITEYLNLLDKIVKSKFENLRKGISEKGSEFEKFIELLPDFSSIKKNLTELMQGESGVKKAWSWFKNNFAPGSIDINIMTKLDRDNFNDDGMLPVEFNDAHAALKGFAMSNLDSSVVLSAGLNPRLYSYFENFSDFFPDTSFNLKKRIVLKVSDYRSALIQGKFLAKKGLWISEYRIESGLNCGGHAFGSDGYLLGPVLEEFKQKKQQLAETLHEIYENALKKKEINCPQAPLPIKITAQGGVGTAEEHEFLLEHFDLDSVGWGTPFLFAPDVTNVDAATLELLKKAREKDLFLTEISPLGVPFNSLRGNSMEELRKTKIKEGNPGSVCIRGYGALNREFTERPICTASRQYQKLKIKDLENQKLPADVFKAEFDKVVVKSCICVGLGTAALLATELDDRAKEHGISICPGPNAAFFSETVSLKKMTDHIYGRANYISRTDRPNMFIQELKMYIDLFRRKLKEATVGTANKKQQVRLKTFKKNLSHGIEYYSNCFSNIKNRFTDTKDKILADLEAIKKELNQIKI